MSVSGADERHAVLQDALIRAADWLTEKAQISGTETPFSNPANYPHADYTGAMRTEYDTQTRRWSINGPVFHSSQAIRALLTAWRRTGDDRYLRHAVKAGDFVLRERISEPDHPERGLLLSLEQNDDEINVQVTVEALSGLLDLYDALGDSRYLEPAVTTANILLERAYLPNERLMRDHYSLSQRAFIGDAESTLPGRAMLDDAVLLRLADFTGDDRYRTVFLAMAERLLEEEGPEGTWLRFPPWRPEIGRIHNRKNWWWGYPLLAAFDATGEQQFHDAAIRAAEWYLRAQNLDGGQYYSPAPDLRHNSFGLCTSVSAVAALYWIDLWRRTADERWLPSISKAIGYLLMAQFRPDVADVDVRGALFESPKRPDGSLCPGFHVRDLAAIFAIRAWDAAMDLPELVRLDGDWADTSMNW